MEFRRAADRLNYFFSPHRWALLFNDPDNPAIQSHLQTLRTACNHWGSKLEFPLQLHPQAFDNSQEALNFWMQKLPKLRLLHYRKQQILLSELYQGYDPNRANQLLRRKLNLDAQAWGHLLYFSVDHRAYVATFVDCPEPTALRDSIAQFHQQHIAERIDAATEQIPGSTSFGTSHGLNDIQTPMAQLLLDATSSNGIAQANRSAQREPDHIQISHYEGTVSFLDMQVTVKLSPQCFAIYCLYLDVEAGFNNKDRAEYQDLAVDHLRRLHGHDEAGIAAVRNCFDMRDDKALRDVFYKVKRDLERALGSKELADPYVIKGPNGGIKRIAIPRDKVSYWNVDRP